MRVLCFLFLWHSSRPSVSSSFTTARTVDLRFLEWSTAQPISVVALAAYGLGMISGWTVVGMLRRSFDRIVEPPGRGPQPSWIAGSLSIGPSPRASRGFLAGAGSDKTRSGYAPPWAENGASRRPPTAGRLRADQVVAGRSAWRRGPPASSPAVRTRRSTSSARPSASFHVRARR